MKDSIMNISLASAAINKKYSDRAPSDYIGECSAKNPEIQQSLKSHYIPEVEKSGLLNDDFEFFLSYRGEHVLNAIMEKLGQRLDIEIDFSRITLF